MKNMNSQIQEAQGIPNRINNNNSIPADFILKLKNTRDKKMIKSREERWITYKEQQKLCFIRNNKSQKITEMKSSKCRETIVNL